MIKSTAGPRVLGTWFSFVRATTTRQRFAFSASCGSEKLETEIQQANERYAGKISIRRASDNKGWGLFALQRFQKGSLVIRANALSESSKQDSHSVQTSWNSHVTMDLPARSINHVCDEANVGIQPNSLGAFDFFALREISIEEELTWDYETSEYEISHGFACACGAASCRGELQGFRYHGPKVLKAYGVKWIAPFLLEDREDNDDDAHRLVLPRP
jgi:hypothetical protein